MISHRHRCIYVKVPKCASTSVLAWFSAHGGGRASFRPVWHGGPLSGRIPAVARLMDLYPDYATFTFVRDPYERFVSTWLHLRRMAQARHGAAWTSAAGLDTLRGFAGFAADVLADFAPCWGPEAVAAFRARRAREYGPGRIRLGDLGWSADHLWPQTAFLPDCNPERLFGVRRERPARLSFIGTVGRIDEDFACLAGLLGLPAAALPRINASGPPRPGPRSYAACYDRATRRTVETLYASDLAFTGCGFDDARAAAVPRNGAGLPARRSGGRPLRTLPARVWHGLWSRQAQLEGRLLRVPGVRRMLRPLELGRGPG